MAAAMAKGPPFRELDIVVIEAFRFVHFCFIFAGNDRQLDPARDPGSFANCIAVRADHMQKLTST